MKTIKMSLCLVYLVLSSCSNSQPLPTISESTNTLSNTSIPIFTTQPSLLLPQIPKGFEWKILPQSNLAILIPNEWFFEQVNYGIDEIYVTKEKIDHYRRFSTGLHIRVFTGFKDSNEAENFSSEILDYYLNLDSEKEILEEWTDTINFYTVHYKRIKASFPFATNENEYKIIELSITQTGKSVYVFIFQSPIELWEQTINDYGILLDNIVILE